jgi:hypothetical protein
MPEMLNAQYAAAVANIVGKRRMLHVCGTAAQREEENSLTMINADERK